ncbi:hypothetical protein CRUP_023822, partial [Coryphaenoides rupestris]
MAAIREHYENVASKNRKDWRPGFTPSQRNSTRSLSAALNRSNPLVLRAPRFKRSLQSLEIELQSQISMVESIPRRHAERHPDQVCSMLAGYQRQVSSLEEQLGDLRAGLNSQKEQYQTLLSIKTRLEMEIARIQKADGRRA